MSLLCLNTASAPQFNEEIVSILLDIEAQLFLSRGAMLITSLDLVFKCTVFEGKTIAKTKATYSSEVRCIYTC